MNHSHILHSDPRTSQPTKQPPSKPYELLEPPVTSLVKCLSLFAVFPQDKEQMTTGIYTTKWFLQCFIDRVRMLWGFFAVLLFACMVNLPVFFCKYHTLKKMLIFYKVGYYAHSHKAKKLIREKLKITACH